jgi:hypothetical protein
MARPRKKSVPTLNIITFCDIITVSMVAMFMVLIIVIDQAMKTPTVRPIPLATATTNAAVYFECRSNQIFYIDRQELTEARTRTLNELRARGVKPENMLQEAMNLDIGNRFYRFDNSFLMMGITALLPRKDASGVTLADVENPTADFLKELGKLDINAHYVVYLVRDDSFDAYRAVRSITMRRGFLTGWEYLGHGEVITFEGMFARIKAE